MDAGNDTKIDEFMFQMMADPSSMAEQLSYMIWGSMAVSSRAIKTVKINIAVNSQIVFASIDFHWWARFERFDKLKKVWLLRARKSAATYIPEGWRFVVYEQKSGTSDGDRMREDADSTARTV